MERVKGIEPSTYSLGSSPVARARRRDRPRCQGRRVAWAALPAHGPDMGTVAEADRARSDYRSAAKGHPPADEGTPARACAVAGRGWPPVGRIRDGRQQFLLLDLACSRSHGSAAGRGRRDALGRCRSRARAEWRQPTNKSDRPHVVPLSAAAAAIIEARPRRRGVPYVFTTSAGGRIDRRSGNFYRATARTAPHAR